MNVKTFLALILAASFSFSAPKTSGIMLNLDYASKPEWVYAIQYQSQCVFVENNVSSTKKTDITCQLDGQLNPAKDQLVFSVKELAVASELYSEQVRGQIKDKLSKAAPSLKLVKGFPSVDMNADLSSGGIPEWNLYLQFAKLLPEMPEKPVKKGFIWERQATIPLTSDKGTTNCEIYRSFKIDSISAAKDLAYISWQFKYAATDNLVDSASLLKYVPFSGSGNGNAFINIAGKYIAKAMVTFETPVAVVGKVKVNWIEKAEMEYKGK